MKLHTQIRLSGSLKNPDIFLKKCQKCVEELEFCMNEHFKIVFKAVSFLKFREVQFGSSSQYVESLHAPYQCIRFFSLIFMFHYE
jgi:hypothetical protein